ncbi:alpha/beta hydrolase [Actinomycetes bacterium]|nr:alpha/beta hydrolase [Actinomycetes bacterium]
MTFRPLAVAVTLALTLATCGNSSSSSDTTANSLNTTTDFIVNPIEWKPCDGSTNTEVECGNIEVPFDYADPEQGSFVLFVKKHNAANPADRIGSMLVNPGGPGFGGSSLADDAQYYFSQDLIDHFDIIAWDPRGTGESTPAVDCVDTFDEYFGLDSPPETPEEKQALIDASQAFNDKCAENSGTILPFISTQASAQDINSLRLALGEEKVSYFGFSYGSELGTTWATMFPDTVRAIVVDGAVDPNASSVQEGMNQAKGFEGQLATFLKQCSEKTTCAFHNGGKAEAAFDQLVLDIDATPLEVSKDRTPVTQGVLFTAVAQAMYSDYYWPQLSEALSAAQKGDGTGILQLYDDYYQRKEDGTYGNELEAFLAISCLDDPGASSVKDVDSHIEDFIAAAPRLGGNFAYGYSCALWPVKQAAKVTITGKGAGPIVVVGTTGDAATPLDSTRKMAQGLEKGILIVVDANQHTGYGANSCVVKAVDDYLIELTVPTNETTCKG